MHHQNAKEFKQLDGLGLLLGYFLWQVGEQSRGFEMLEGVTTVYTPMGKSNT